MRSEVGAGMVGSRVGLDIRILVVMGISLGRGWGYFWRMRVWTKMRAIGRETVGIQDLAS